MSEKEGIQKIFDDFSGERDGNRYMDIFGFQSAYNEIVGTVRIECAQVAETYLSGNKIDSAVIKNIRSIIRYRNLDDTVLNPTASKAVSILRQYATEHGYLTRSISDLSPLEEWLLAKLINHEEVSPYSGKDKLEAIIIHKDKEE